MSKKILFILSAIFMITLLTSCNRKIGSGVVLWSENEDIITSGSIVNIYEESRIRHTYTVGEIDSKETLEMDTWRISFFEKLADAKAYRESYSPYFTSYAYSTRQGLPIRESESTDSDRVYKLRDGQEIKVIGRADEAVDIGRFNGYWYKVLTEDGVTGHVFDYYLSVFSINDTGRVLENAKDTSDPLLDIFLSSTWRPSYFNDMIIKGIIDLSSFKDSYALKVDTEKKEITLRSQTRNITESYTDITQFRTKRYDFEGSSFRVTLVSDKVASVEFTDEDRAVNEVFVTLDEDVNDIISAELERRDALLKGLIERGSIFKSANYGSINIIDGTGRFIWNDVERLISRNIISSQSEPQGRIYFNHFPDSLIKNVYEGVITFDFRNGSEASFLYSYTKTGVSFIYVPDRYIKNLIVTTDTFFDPIQIYFEFDPSSAAETEEPETTEEVE